MEDVKSVSEMFLTVTGRVNVNGFLATFTKDGEWIVTRKGAIIGYADSLIETLELIERECERARVRLVEAERKASERKVEEEDMPAEIRGATLQK